MKYGAIIFDMDGTIVDTESIWKEATLTLLSRRGFTFDSHQEEILHQSLHGVAMPAACTWLKEQFDIDDPLHHLIDEKSQLAHTLYRSNLQFVPGFQDFHRSTQTKKLPTGVATNATKSILDLTNEILNLHQFFGDHLYSIDHVERVSKPNPAVYLFAANQLEVDPKNCIAIEDSLCGIAAAKAAGMYCIGINTARNREQLKQADQIIDGYHELEIHKLGL